jgi:hypothetical protein
VTRLFDAPSYNAGIDACRSIIDAVQQEIEARFSLSMHRREIGAVFGVLAAELAALRIGPNGEPPALAPVGDDPTPPSISPMSAEAIV